MQVSITGKEKQLNWWRRKNERNVTYVSLERNNIDRKSDRERKKERKERKRDRKEKKERERR